MSVEIERSFGWLGIVVYCEKESDNSRVHLSLPGCLLASRVENNGGGGQTRPKARDGRSRPLIGRDVNDDELHFNLTQIMSAWRQSSVLFSPHFIGHIVGSYSAFL